MSILPNDISVCEGDTVHIDFDLGIPREVIRESYVILEYPDGRKEIVDTDISDTGLVRCDFPIKESGRYIMQCQTTLSNGHELTSKVGEIDVHSEFASRIVPLSSKKVNPTRVSKLEL